MSRKSKDFELVTIKKKRNDKLEFEVSHNPGTQNTHHYQCLSATNREEPEQFMNSTRKQEAEPGALEPEVYRNIARAKTEALPNTGLSQEKYADKDAADVTPAPAVLSHNYIKAKPVTKNLRNAAGSDTESDTFDFAPTSSHSPPQQGSTSNAYSITPAFIGKQSLTTETALCDFNLQTPTSSSKKDERGSRNKCLLVVCCVLVFFLVFTLSLTFVGLNRSELEKNQEEDSHSTVTSNMLIMNLTKQVRDLEESLNQSKAVIQNLSTRLAAHVSDYRDLVSTSENNHNTLTASISGNYADLNNRINTLLGVVNTNNASANHKISQLQNGINLESRCRKNSVSCDVYGNSSVYQLSCSTQNIPMTTGVSLC